MFTTEFVIKILIAIPTAIVLGILAMAVWLGFCYLAEIILRSKAEWIAIAQFKLDFPQEEAGFTGKQKDNGQNIVMVAYGHTRPLRRVYYHVDVQERKAALIKDDSRYRPKYDR